MKHAGRRPKKKRHVAKSSRIIIARDIERAIGAQAGSTARYYAGPNTELTGGPTVVVWKNGRFTVRAAAGKTNLARMPKGLAKRVDDALERGKLNG